jgi:hypothetical protein
MKLCKCGHSREEHDMDAPGGSRGCRHEENEELCDCLDFEEA